MADSEEKRLCYEKQWMKQTYCYGFCHVENSQNPKWVRAYWIGSILGCAVAMAVQLHSTFVSYLEYNSTTLISVESIDTLPFPSVSVCNFDRFKNERINSWLQSFPESGIQKEIIRLILLKSPAVHESSPRWFEEVAGNFDNFSAETKRRLENIFLEDILDELGHGEAELFKRCEWFGDRRNGTRLECDQISFFKTTFGHCMTFNPDGGRYSSSHGPYNGLSLVLSGEEGLLLAPMLDQKRYQVEGFSVLVHPPKTSPMQIILNHLMFPGGKQVNVEIEPLKFEMIGPPWGRCSDDKQLRFSRVYTQEMCELECRIVYLQRNCSCRIVGFEEMNQHGPDRNQSMMDNLTRCSILEHIHCINNFLLFSMGTELFKNMCDCPIPCSMVQYRPHISIADTPAGLENTSSRLSVFFGSKSFVTFRQQPAVTIHQLLSSVGGQCALFMGMSMVTFSEIIVYFIRRLLSWANVLGVSTPTPTSQQSPAVSTIL